MKMKYYDISVFEDIDELKNLFSKENGCEMSYEDIIILLLRKDDMATYYDLYENYPASYSHKVLISFNIIKMKDKKFVIYNGKRISDTDFNRFKTALEKINYDLTKLNPYDMAKVRLDSLMQQQKTLSITCFIIKGKMYI